MSRHGQYSGHDFTYTDGETGEMFVPWIVETSGGVDRMFLFLLLDAYREDGDRVFLKLHPKLSPYTAAVFPLVRNKPDITAKAKEVYKHAKMHLKLSTVWDDRGNIGKRYYAQDEIGTPFCITIDYTTLEDETVTVRDRDSAEQIMLPIEKIEEYIRSQMNAHT